jgi:RecJ-like exonuclease
VRLKNTHAKVLVGDDFYVTTSFNWLSFRGDSSRRYRMEEGTLIRDRALADQAYERYLDQIRQQAIEVVGDLPEPRGRSASRAAPMVPPQTAANHTRKNREGVEKPSVARKQRRTPNEEDWSRLKVGSTIAGTVKNLTNFGVFVTLGDGIDGLIHNSRLPQTMNGNQVSKFEVGQSISVKILEIQPERNRVSLGMA